MSNCAGLVSLVTLFLSSHGLMQRTGILESAMHAVSAAPAVTAADVSSLLQHASPCAPKATAADGGLMKPSAVKPRGLKFFLHDSGALNFTTVVTCLSRSWGLQVDSFDGFSGVDGLTGPDKAEHLGELWFLQRLQAHPDRTHTPEAADIHFVAVPSFASYLASGAGCGDHEARMEAVREQLAASSLYRDNAGKFVFIMTSPRIHDVLGESFLNFLSDHGSIVATTDRYYPGWHPYTYSPEKSPLGIRKFILPYKAHSFLDSAVADSVPTLPGQLRPTSFYFHGNVNRTAQGHLRQHLLGLSSKLAASDIQDVKYWANYEKIYLDARRTARAMTQSQFCFVPAGDTPSSRRLYDSLAAGCIPIVLAEFETFTRSLPFLATVEWSKVAIFAGSLQCMADNMDEFTSWLLRLPSEPNLESIRKAGRSVFASHLSYVNGDGIVSAFLAQLSAELF